MYRDMITMPEYAKVCSGMGDVLLVFLSFYNGSIPNPPEKRNMFNSLPKYMECDEFQHVRHYERWGGPDNRFKRR